MISFSRRSYSLLNFSIFEQILRVIKIYAINIDKNGEVMKLTVHLTLLKKSLILCLNVLESSQLSTYSLLALHFFLEFIL